jgi:hypothetical protein
MVADSVAPNSPVLTADPQVAVEAGMAWLSLTVALQRLQTARDLWPALDLSLATLDMVQGNGCSGQWMPTGFQVMRGEELIKTYCDARRAFYFEAAEGKSDQEDRKAATIAGSAPSLTAGAHPPTTLERNLSEHSRCH